MGREISGTNRIVQRSLNVQIPGYPDLYIPIVDVRDVAAAHLAAMTAPDDAGQRFLIASDSPADAIKDIGALLRDHLGDTAKRVPTRTIPNAAVRLAAVFSAEYRPVASDLGYRKKTSNAKARQLLGLHPRPAPEAIIAAADSMVAKSLVRPS